MHESWVSRGAEWVTWSITCCTHTCRYSDFLPAPHCSRRPEATRHRDKVICFSLKPPWPPPSGRAVCRRPSRHTSDPSPGGTFPSLKHLCISNPDAVTHVTQQRGTYTTNKAAGICSALFDNQMRHSCRHVCFRSSAYELTLKFDFEISV